MCEGWEYKREAFRGGTQVQVRLGLFTTPDQLPEELLQREVQENEGYEVINSCWKENKNNESLSFNICANICCSKFL